MHHKQLYQEKWCCSFSKNERHHINTACASQKLNYYGKVSCFRAYDSICQCLVWSFQYWLVNRTKQRFRLCVYGRDVSQVTLTSFSPLLLLLLYICEHEWVQYEECVHTCVTDSECSALRWNGDQCNIYITLIWPLSNTLAPLQPYLCTFLFKWFRQVC